MLRKLGLIVAVACMLLAGKVSALGLGEIKVKSALNEPLVAEIALFQVKGLSPLQIKSQMADLNDFALSGLATQRALSNVRFQTRVRANGTGRIILTSTLPVTEPFMNFLVEVNWPNGRLIREYTLLLDPPSYSSQQNNRNFSTKNNLPKSTPVNSNKPASRTQSVAPKRVPTEVKLNKGQYYISDKDTLWDIAIANRVNKSVSAQQMMVLIQRKNPQAFPNANINVMTANVVIDLPTQAEIEAFSKREAQQEVTRQTTLWKSGKLPKVVSQGTVQRPKAQARADKKPESTDSIKDQKAATTKSVEKDPAMGKTVESTPTENQDKPEATNKQMPALDANGEPIGAEKGILNVVSPDKTAAKRELQAKADTLALAASKDSEKISELLISNAELDVKLALSQESIDKLERDNKDLNEKLSTISEQLADINRLIMLKDEQLSAIQDERLDEEDAKAQEDKKEADKSWLDRLLENPLGLMTAGIGWLLAIIAGVLLLLKRKKKEVLEVDDNTKSEPSISLPDDMLDEAALEEELGELEELADPELAESHADDIDDLALDLDLDMDIDLDESLEDAAIDITLGNDDSDDGLAAELEAQLESAEEDDDLDMLDGIDSLEFDLGESEDDQELSSDEAAEKQALAEFAAAMEAPDDDEQLESLFDEPESSEFAEDELSIEMADIDETMVEEDDLDIADIDIDTDVTSLDALEALEGLAEEGVEQPGNAEAQADQELNALEDDPLDIDLDIDLDEEIDLPAETEQTLDESLELDDLEDMSLDDAATDIEEEEQVPMDDALGELLGSQEAVEDDFEEASSDEVIIEEVTADDVSEETEPTNRESATQMLEEQLDELLSSTDDDIALEEVAPEFDAKNEDEIDLLSGEDGVRMKLDLARAYIEMGDAEGAKDIITEVMESQDDDHLQEAQAMLDSL